MTFDEIGALVKEYYEPTPSAIVQRFKFNTRSRSSGESIAGYVAALRELAEHCQYGASLAEMLRDRLVCGVNHEGIQKKLLSEKDLDYEKAFTLAQAIEAAEKDTKNLKQEGSPRSQPGPVQQQGSQQQAPSQGKCSNPSHVLSLWRKPLSTSLST